MADSEEIAIVACLKKTRQTNDKLCELMSFSRFIQTINPASILKTVSVTHECTNTCKVETSATISAEREDIHTDKYYSITHDFTNNLYCLNRYCICSV